MGRPKTLRGFLAECRKKDEDVDIYVDGHDAIAYCGNRLTEEGATYFKKALDLTMNGHAVVGDDDDELDLAWQMLVSMAGYCSCDDYDRWFLD